MFTLAAIRKLHDWSHGQARVVCLTQIIHAPFS
jgi:hypothetical protein